MYNYSKIKGAIKEKFDNQAQFAEALGIGESTLSLKLNNKTEWTQGEMVAALNLLGISVDQVEDYFFAH